LTPGLLDHKELLVSELKLDRQVRRRLAVLRHVEEVSGNVAMTCRYFGISRPTLYVPRTTSVQVSGHRCVAGRHPA